MWRFSLLISYVSRVIRHLYFVSRAMHTCSDRLLWRRYKRLSSRNYYFFLIFSYLSENELKELPEGIFDGLSGLLSM